MPVSRRRLKVWFAGVAGVVVVALVASTAYLFWSAQRPHPNYGGTAEVARLSGDVEVVRDKHGIPHIYADTPEDLFRAQGYVHAQDRFWEMDLRRHITAGRLSELFGEDQVETDAFVRTLGWRRVAQEELPVLSPETRRYLTAYADGVNSWMDGRAGGELALGYTILGVTGGDDSPEPWTAVDSLAWLKAMAWDLSENLRDEADRAILSAVLPEDRVDQLHPPASPDVSPPIVADTDLPETSGKITTDKNAARAGSLPTLENFASAVESLSRLPTMVGKGAGVGSNSWVVSGEHTESGEPILANDPHLAPSLPSIWYQIGLHCRTVTDECPFDVVGFSFSSLPGVVIGHNQQIAWGFSNLGADVADLYLEQVRRDAYRVGDSWQPLDSRTERIEVAGAADVEITVRSTRNGPLISDHDEGMRDVGDVAGVRSAAPLAGDNYAVALRWTALEPGFTADALFRLNRATNWREFRAAASSFEVPSQNLIYADVEGNIGYQAPGKIPVRTKGDGTYPAPGWDDDYQWEGYVPFKDLPFVLNPDEGFIVTANQQVAGESYEYLLSEDFQQGFRAGRIREVLEAGISAGDPLTVNDMSQLQLDDRNLLAEVLVPQLLDLRAPKGYYGDGLRLLSGWNYSQSADSGAAAYFNAVWANVLRLTFHDELPEDSWPRGGGRWYLVMEELLDRPDDPFWDDVQTDAVERKGDILRRVIRDARDDMTQRQGKDPDNWAWGRLHELEMKEMTFGSSGIGPIEWLYNRDSVPVGGGRDAVLATGWDAAEGYQTIWVPSMRMVVDLDDFDRSRWIDLTGISGHPRHEHYGDQTALWRDGETLPMRWDDEAVCDAAEDELTLVPAD